MNNENPQRRIAGWMLFAFALWVFAFRDYLSSRLELINDALSYYDHTKFFVENLRHGIYPLWDPFWYYGSPNDFFLRRIGAFNPFYLIILLFKSVGIPYTLSYLWSLAFYYATGMAAFYLLAMRLYNNRLLAYAGYLILMFSALGTRTFDSYMMLITVPLIWFFYFLTAFSQTPRRHLFCGIILSFMILAGTYIPFYFFIILAFVLFFFLVIYFDLVPDILRRWAGFFRENKLLVWLSLGALFFSFLPLIFFFYESAQGHVLLPARHEAAGGHQLTVAYNKIEWGAVEDIVYSAYFTNLRLYQFAVIYVPFFSVIVLALGLVGRLTRRTVFIFLTGTVLFCCIIPHGLPLYNFFYHHVFFVKYFRNLHFFIWFFLIPLFVLLALEHWKMFTDIKPSGARRWLLLGYVIFVHTAAFIFIWWRQEAVISTYIMMALSLLFWCLMVLGILKENFWGFALLTLTVLVQPMEAYHYYAQKTAPHTRPYDYDFSYTAFDSLKTNVIGRFPAGDLNAQKIEYYYVSNGYNFIYRNVSNYALARYLDHKFLLVDHLEPVGQAGMASVLERLFSNGDNAAAVLDPSPSLALNSDDPDPPAKAQPLTGDVPGFKVLDFNADHIRISLDLPYKKFLVYNDNWDPYWHACINGQQAALYEANGSFKGLWVPAGHNVIEFSYGYWWQYAVNILLSILALGLLIGIVKA